MRRLIYTLFVISFVISSTLHKEHEIIYTPAILLTFCYKSRTLVVFQEREKVKKNKEVFF